MPQIRCGQFLCPKPGTVQRGKRKAIPARSFTQSPTVGLDELFLEAEFIQFICASLRPFWCMIADALAHPPPKVRLCHKPVELSLREIGAVASVYCGVRNWAEY
ncbi:unnamed protein product [Protopolystoma xenopodis]|uniref:Uncharacterized protein n=1 Tax=Protopolystoma xenopodis TaxID=117903 RepID=A0A448WSU6_9PLAT|nr:unnamed protein product [Protopolystoma xenopodis]